MHIDAGMNGIDKYTQDDYDKALAQLRQASPLTPDSGPFIGHTHDGRTILFPNSYLSGYRSVLNGMQLRVIYDVLGLAGQLSDGTWVYLPSFNDGIRTALNEARFAALAEAQRRSWEQMMHITQQQEEMKRRQEEQTKRTERDETEKQEFRKTVEDLKRQLSSLKEEQHKKG